MDPTRRRLLAAATGALTLPLAGCVDGGTGGNDADDGAGGYGMDTTTETETTESATESDTTESDTTDAPASTEGGPTLAVETLAGYGDVVVGPDGLTLYMFEPDPSDASGSACTGDCAEAWPPLTVEDPAAVAPGDDVTGPVDTLTREDGSTQVALGGWPLYYFQGDAEPGDVSGQGVNQVWWVLGPDGTPREPAVQVREHPDHGTILTDAEGMTLYMFDMDTQGSGESVCTDDCADAWPPLTVDEEKEILAGSEVTADVGTITRPDDSMQVTVEGWPVYGFQNDDAVGDASGQGVNDAWWVLAPDGSVVRPESAMETTTTTATEEPGGGGDY